MDSQRAAGQGDAKAHSKTARGAPRAHPGAPYGAWGRPQGAPVDFGVRFRIALAGRALRIHAPGPLPRTLEV